MGPGPVGSSGKCQTEPADRALLAQSMQQQMGQGLGPGRSGRLAHAIPHQVAVVLLDHIAQMDADAELDATLRRKTGVAARSAHYCWVAGPRGRAEVIRDIRTKSALPLIPAGFVRRTESLDKCVTTDTAAS